MAQLFQYQALDKYYSKLAAVWPMERGVGTQWDGLDAHGSLAFTLVGPPDTTTSGAKHNYRGTFNGANQYGHQAVGAASPMDLTDSFTLSCWLEVDGPGSSLYVIGRYDIGYSEYQWLLFRRFSSPNYYYYRFYVDDGLGSTVHIESGSIGYSNNDHVVCVYDASAQEIHIYVNGTKSTLSVGVPSSLSSFGQVKLAIGARLWSGAISTYSAMKIDEIYLWKGAAFGQTEVDALYNSGTGRFLDDHEFETTVPAGFDVRESSQIAVPAGFDSLRDTLEASVPAGFEARAQSQLAVPAGLEIAQQVETSVPGGARIVRIQVANIAAVFGIRAQQGGDGLLGVPSQNQARSQRKWDLYARDKSDDSETHLGTITEDDSPKQVTAALSDGTYDIIIRPSDLLWQEVETRVVTTLVVDSGDVESQGLPAIDNLSAQRSTIHEDYTEISWDVSDQGVTRSYSFGVWFGAASPVSIAGDPDISKPSFPGNASYSVLRDQSAAEYVAVAAIASDGTRGPKSELSLPWSAAPDSPAGQQAIPQ
jgi:hypothetical protein